MWHGTFKDKPELTRHLLNNDDPLSIPNARRSQPWKTRCRKTLVDPTYAKRNTLACNYRLCVSLQQSLNRHNRLDSQRYDAANTPTYTDCTRDHLQHQSRTPGWRIDAVDSPHDQPLIGWLQADFLARFRGLQQRSCQIFHKRFHPRKTGSRVFVFLTLTWVTKQFL